MFNYFKKGKGLVYITIIGLFICFMLVMHCNPRAWADTIIVILSCSIVVLAFFDYLLFYADIGTPGVSFYDSFGEYDECNCGHSYTSHKLPTGSGPL